MIVRRLGGSWLSVVLVLISIFLAPAIAMASDIIVPKQPPKWLEAASFLTENSGDLLANAEPISLGYECGGSYTYNGSLPRCIYTTPMGKVSNNVLIDGNKGPYPLDISSGQTMPSVPGRDSLIITRYFPSGGGNTLAHSTYDPTSLRYVEYFGYPTKRQYEYRPTNPIVLKDPSGNPYNVLGDSLAYSLNGEWLVVALNKGGILVVRLDNWESRVITLESGSTGFINETRASNLAISNNGNFVAVNPPLGNTPTGAPSLRVYDVSTCLDQSKYTSDRALSNPCEYRDIWNDTFRGTAGSVGVKLAAAFAGLEYPRHLRFSADNALSFEAVHDRSSASAFQVTRYTVSVNEYGPPPIGLLALGDSYISGEGAYRYRYPTDTKFNKCHNSLAAYSLVYGKKHFPAAASVACSGAMMEDVKNTTPSYMGQEHRIKPLIEWGDRLVESRESIKSNFLPGYIGQKQYIADLHPRATIISIGGNDFGFADIVKTCVMSPDSCNHSYEDRLEILNKITSKYPSLVDTYKEVKSKSRGRVYVVGYPQLFKEGGNCALNVNMNAEEIKLGNQLATFMNMVIKRAADDAGVFYVNIENSLDGYRLCEAVSGNSGVNGLVRGDDKSAPLSPSPFTWGFLRVNILGNESYHPTANGHKKIGDKIVDQTKNFTLSMPAATNRGKPTINVNDPILVNAPRENRTVFDVQYANSGDVTMLLKGDKYKTQLPQQTFAPGSKVKGVLRSDPIELFNLPVEEVKNHEVTIPQTTKTGLHTLHFYGKGISGNDIDVRQLVYVTESYEDYDGDGVGNTESECLVFTPADLDADNDNIDDVCDGIIGVEPEPETVIDESSGFTQDMAETGTHGTEQSDTLIMKDVKPATASDSAPDNGADTKPIGGSGVGIRQPSDVSSIRITLFNGAQIPSGTSKVQRTIFSQTEPVNIAEVLGTVDNNMADIYTRNTANGTTKPPSSPYGQKDLTFWLWRVLFLIAALIFTTAILKRNKSATM